MSGKVISFINMKGGVGKTTLSIGIADFLADNDKKILIIDADPQFNCTQALLDYYRSNQKYEFENNENFYTKEVHSKGKTIYSLFRPTIDVYDSYESPRAQDIIINLKSNLDILSGDLNLVLVNKINDHGYVRRISDFIDDNNLRKVYDLIIIDCPPTITLYTDSALLASDFYIIPNRIDRYSIIGIDSLQKAVNNLIKQERLSLKCLGLIYSMVDKNLGTKQLDIKNSFESKKNVADLDIFSSIFTVTNHIQHGKSGTIPTKYHNSKEDIEAISLELLERISNFEVVENE